MPIFPTHVPLPPSAQLNHLDKKFCELFEEYLPYLGMRLSTIKTSQLRVIPVESAVQTAGTVESYNRVRFGGAQLSGLRLQEALAQSCPEGLVRTQRLVQVVVDGTVVLFHRIKRRVQVAGLHSEQRPQAGGVGPKGR